MILHRAWNHLTMDPRAVAGVVLYAVLVAALALPAFAGDEWLAVLTLLAAAHVGLGAAVRRPWAVLLPVALCLIAFVAGGAEGLAWVILILGAPALVLLTLVGWGLAAVLPRDGVALACLAVALVPAGWALVDTAQRGPHVPATLQRQLPIDYSLGNLCPHAETPPALERRLRREAEVLIRELGRRPRHLVTYTFHDAHSADEDRRDITIRELAEEQLAGMQPDCSPDLQRRLRAAL